MALNIQDDIRPSNASLIKEMIQSTKIDLYEFSIKTQKKLDYILQIVDTSLKKTEVKDQEVQTEVNEKQDFLNNKIFVRQDLFQPPFDDEQESLQEQQNLNILITVNNSDHSDNLEQGISMNHMELSDDDQNKSKDDMQSVVQSHFEQQSELCTNPNSNSIGHQAVKHNKEQRLLRVISKLSNNEHSSQDSEGSSNEGRNSIDSKDFFPVLDDREWLFSVNPMKSPYFPQIGDDVVYIQQCHMAFFQFVNSMRLYEIHESDMPWTKYHFRAHEFAKVIKISYKRPNYRTRICCLTLQQTKQSGKKAKRFFNVDYHYVKNNPYDFLILRQHFDIALARNWQVGSRFRWMLGNVWYFGRILAVNPRNPQEFPNSTFECLRIETDDGSKFNVSPWNIEPIDENQPEKKGVPVPVTSEDLRKLRYQPRPNEWHHDGRTAICRRVQAELDEIMQGAIAAPFVRLRDNPSYVSKVDYPIDLEMISARLGNLFYRRVIALEFDIKYLARNFETDVFDLQSSTNTMSFSYYKHQVRFIRNRILDCIVEATKSVRWMSDIRDSFVKSDERKRQKKST